MRIVFILITLVAVSTLSHAATLKVPTQHLTIQAAINAAQNGDTVLVDDGTYVENIDFLGKAITVTSENGANVTVIDGNQNGSVVTFDSQEDEYSVLDGFTITNGTGTYNSTYGYLNGGIHFENQSSPTIQNNTVTGNTADRVAGIGGLNYCSPVITGNLVYGNTAAIEGGGVGFALNCAPTISSNEIVENSAPTGGGLIFVFASSPTITDNLIKDNKATQSFGGGIRSYDGCSGFVYDNIITGNSAVQSGGGLIFLACTTTVSDNTITDNHAGWAGGIQVEFGSLVFENNFVAGNTATNYCGGIRFMEDASTVVNNTVVNNSGVLGGGLNLCSSSATVTNNLIHGNSADVGGGIYCWDDTTAAITNNVVYGNSAKNSGGGLWINMNSKSVITNSIFWDNTLTNGSTGPEIWVGGMSDLTISYSDVDGGQSSCWVASNSSLTWGPGMINANPLFVNGPGGDLHIPHHSPCCGTGDNGCSGLPAEDFEGDPRICYGTVDMGADEHFRHLYYTGDATPGGNVDVILTGLPGTKPVGLIVGFGLYDPPLTSMWGDWYVMHPWIGPIALGLMPTPDGVLIINGLLPGTPPGPYSIYMQAIIGDKLTNLCTMDVK